MLRIVAAPMFEGRPEIEITDLIIKYARDNNIQHSVLSDGIYPNPGPEAVYDDYVMARYYLRMTSAVIDQMQDGDTIFWVDAWNPVLASLWHVCNAQRITVYNYGIWHSSPITPGDYLEGSNWAGDFQMHLTKYLNGIFVATNYLKNSCEPEDCTSEELDRIQKKIHVTGLPFDDSVIVKNDKKRNVIVYPHRWASDKCPSQFVALAKYYDKIDYEVFTPTASTIPLVKTECVKQGVDPDRIRVVVNENKQVYYERLSEVKFVWANSVLETFGYAVLEAYLSGAIPILNDMPCYRELYPNSIYRSLEDIIDLIENSKWENVVFNAPTDPVGNMFSIIKEKSYNEEG